MATSSRVRLFEPFKIWILLNCLGIIGFFVASLVIFSLAATQNQVLIQAQREILVRSKIDDLKKGDFRNFVESTGNQFKDLYVSIKAGKLFLETGRPYRVQHCSAETIPNLSMYRPGITVTMCRPFLSPIVPLILVFSGYLVLAIISFGFAKKLEQKTTTSLVKLVNQYGLSVDEKKGLVAILNTVSDLQIKLLEARKRELELVKSESMVRIASQVAHDIRSPLAALNVAAQELRTLPEETRNLLMAAVRRIQDIANNLIQQSKKTPPHLAQHSADQALDLQTSSKLLSHLLSPVIDSIISEKRLQYRSRLNLQIEFPFEYQSYGLSSSFDPTELKRILSNLIDNAVEAIQGSGKISVSLQTDKNNIVIQIKDTGKGISSELIPRLGERGFSFGKAQGSGLGLNHAMSTMRFWGGDVKIDSTLGKGTTVSLSLPKTNPPEWFVSELKIKSHSKIVILDDEVTTHQIWEKNFEVYQIKRHQIEVHHFSRPLDLISYLKDKGPIPKNFQFLIDYEFSNETKDGIELIEELKIQYQSILVTSHYEEPAILEKCRRLNLKLIPKGLIGFVPIAQLPLRQ